MKRAAFASVALVASAVAVGQQTTPRTSAQTETSTTRQEQTAPRISETDKLILINDCARQVLAAHPSVPEKDVKAYCEDKVKSYSSQR